MGIGLKQVVVAVLFLSIFFPVRQCIRSDRQAVCLLALGLDAGKLLVISFWHRWSKTVWPVVVSPTHHVTC